MNRLTILLLLLLPRVVFSQVKIDSGYALINGKLEYTQDNSGSWALIPEAFAVRQTSTGKVCKFQKYNAVFLIKGESYTATNPESFKKLSAKLEPKDKIYFDNIKLGGCDFAPPQSVVITIQ